MTDLISTVCFFRRRCNHQQRTVAKQLTCNLILLDMHLDVLVGVQRLGNLCKITHVAAIISGHIIIRMRSVNNNLCHQLRQHKEQIQRRAIDLVNSVEHRMHFCRDLNAARLVVSISKTISFGISSGNLFSCFQINGMDHLVARLKVNRANLQIHFFVIIKLEIDIQRFSFQRNLCAGSKPVDSGLVHAAYPYRSCHGNIAVCFYHFEIIVRILVVNLKFYRCLVSSHRLLIKH